MDPGSISRELDQLKGSLTSKTVIGTVELLDVDRALLTDATITIRIVTGITFDADDETDLQAAVEAIGPNQYDKERRQLPVQAMLHVYDRTLGKIENLTKRRDGSFSFTGVHHSSYNWEANYNAGWHEEHTYTTYRVHVDREKKATYEIVDTKERSSRL